jgi:hypothetical protein
MRAAGGPVTLRRRRRQGRRSLLPLAAMLAASVHVHVHVHAAAATLATYTVAVDTALSRLAVRACARVAPLRLTAGSAVLRAQLPAAGARLRWHGDALEFVRAGCIDYAVPVAALARGDGRDAVARAGSDLIVAPEFWLPLPDLGSGERRGGRRGGRRGDHVDVDFVLPPGIRVSTPWQPRARPPAAAGGGARYRIHPSPGGFRAVVAFGRFDVRHIRVGGASLDVVVLDGYPRPESARLVRWVEETASQVLHVGGRFPLPALQVVVTPVLGNGLYERDGLAVPMARVLRSGGNGVQLYVNQLAADAALRVDPTATHEFAHLLLPFVERSGAWLPEGVASYYQVVLRARAGVVDTEAAFRELVEGFRRGRGTRPYAQSLAASIREHGDNVLMRTYWSGAALALLADVQLRTRAERPESLAAPHSLDAVLAAFAVAELPSARAWTAAEVVARLDAIAGGTTLADLADRWLSSREFPDLLPAWQRLGVAFGAGGDVAFSSDPAAVALREAIMRGAR